MHLVAIVIHNSSNDVDLVRIERKDAISRLSTEIDEFLLRKYFTQVTLLVDPVLPCLVTCNQTELRLILVVKTNHSQL